MKVHTTRFGEIEVDSEKIICFSQGLLGFETLNKFTVIPVDDKETFTWLQSTEEPHAAFLLTDPFAFFSDYAVDLNPAICKALSIRSREEVVIQAIITIPETGVKDMTANLVGPVVINVKNRIGKQIVLTDSGYTTRHRLFSNCTVSGEGCGLKAGEA